MNALQAGGLETPARSGIARLGLNSSLLRRSPRRRPKGRRPVHVEPSLDDFVDLLNASGVRYVVLRGLDGPTRVHPGAHIELLVADEDVLVVDNLLRPHVGAPPAHSIRLYSVSGLPGSDDGGMPHYPPALARNLLNRAVLLGGRIPVPSPVDGFDALAYRTVYREGRCSGLPESATDAHGGMSVPFGLAGLAASIPVQVPLTLQDLDAYLAGKGLRPPAATLSALAEANPWLRDQLQRERELPGPGLAGLAVFLLWPRVESLVDRLREELLRDGWEPVETVLLDPEDAARLEAATRGRNRGALPTTVAGEGPYACVVAWDLTSSMVRADDSRILQSTIDIRRRLVAHLATAPPIDLLHSSRNPRQAIDYLQHLGDQDRVERTREHIAGIRDAMRFPYPVVEMLPSQRRRSVSAVVDHPEFGHCVCKLFYASTLRYLHREVRARTELGDLSEVPALLEVGTSWLVTPRYEDTRAHVRRRLPGLEHMQLTWRTSMAMADLTRDLHRRGCFLLDLTPQNLLTDREAGLKVLDWEFLQDFPDAPTELRHSPTVVGRARGLGAVDEPLGVSWDATVTALHPTVTGLPVRLLLRWPHPALAVVAEAGLLLAFGARSLRMAARWGRDRVRRAAPRERLTPGHGAAAP